MTEFMHSSEHNEEVNYLQILSEDISIGKSMLIS